MGKIKTYRDEFFEITGNQNSIPTARGSRRRGSGHGGVIEPRAVVVSVVVVDAAAATTSGSRGGRRSVGHPPQATDPEGVAGAGRVRDAAHSVLLSNAN